MRLSNEYGVKSLLTDGDNVYKIRKSNEYDVGYRTAIMYLAPEKTSGIGNVCNWASPGCTGCCLFTAGRGAMNSVQQSRIRRTKFWYGDRQGFLKQLNLEIERFIKKCAKLDQIATFRLNGTSDLRIHKFLDFSQYPDCQFYDYTKDTTKMYDFMEGKLPENYHLTYSRSELNEAEALLLKRQKANVAVVFHPYIPERYKRFSTFSADAHDLRFLDPPKGIAALTAKGKAKRDTTGFTVML